MSEAKSEESSAEGATLNALFGAWQPANTAPRDTWVLAFAPITPLGDHVIARAFRGTTIDGEDIWWCEGAWFTPKEVTHWMPMPEAPNAKDQPT